MPRGRQAPLRLVLRPPRRPTRPLPVPRQRGPLATRVPPTADTRLQRTLQWWECVNVDGQLAATAPKEADKRLEEAGGGGRGS